MNAYADSPQNLKQAFMLLKGEKENSFTSCGESLKSRLSHVNASIGPMITENLKEIKIEKKSMPNLADNINVIFPTFEFESLIFNTSINYNVNSNVLNALEQNQSSMDSNAFRHVETPYGMSLTQMDQHSGSYTPRPNAGLNVPSYGRPPSSMNQNAVQQNHQMHNLYNQQGFPAPGSFYSGTPTNQQLNMIQLNEQQQFHNMNEMNFNPRLLVTPSTKNFDKFNQIPQSSRFMPEPNYVDNHIYATTNQYQHTDSRNYSNQTPIRRIPALELNTGSLSQNKNQSSHNLHSNNSVQHQPRLTDDHRSHQYQTNTHNQYQQGSCRDVIDSRTFTKDDNLLLEMSLQDIPELATNNNNHNHNINNLNNATRMSNTRQPPINFKDSPADSSRQQPLLFKKVAPYKSGSPDGRDDSQTRSSGKRLSPTTSSHTRQNTRIINTPSAKTLHNTTQPHQLGNYGVSNYNNTLHPNGHYNGRSQDKERLTADSRSMDKKQYDQLRIKALKGLLGGRFSETIKELKANKLSTLDLSKAGKLKRT